MRALTALVALLLVGAALALQACGGGGSGSFDIRDDPRLEQYDNELTAEGQAHYPSTVDVSYETVPPYGGPHDSIPLPCGIYTSEAAFRERGARDGAWRRGGLVLASPARCGRTRGAQRDRTQAA